MVSCMKKYLLSVISIVICLTYASPLFPSTELHEEINQINEKMDLIASSIDACDQERLRLEKRIKELRKENRNLLETLNQGNHRIASDLVTLHYLHSLENGLDVQNAVAGEHVWRLQILQKALLDKRIMETKIIRLKLSQLNTINGELEKHLAEIEDIEKNYRAMLEKLKSLKQQKEEALERMAINERTVMKTVVQDKPVILQPSEEESLKTTPLTILPEIDGMKGKLPLPVKGQLLTENIQKKDSALQILRYNRGVFIRAKPGLPVQSVAAGRVVFARWFRDLGRTIIIDHGSHFFSVYAFMGDVFKTEGDVVKAGEIIGTVGAPELTQEAGVYFEWRKNGRPLVVKEWFLVSKMR